MDEEERIKQEEKRKGLNLPARRARLDLKLSQKGIDISSSQLPARGERKDIASFMEDQQKSLYKGPQVNEDSLILNPIFQNTFPSLILISLSPHLMA